MSPAQTLFASPPDNEWTFRHYDATILNVDGDTNWPWSGLHGEWTKCLNQKLMKTHCDPGHVVQLRCIMCPLCKNGIHWPWENKFLVYVQHFDICSKDATSQLKILKHAKWTNGQHLGDVVPLCQVWAFAHLIPHYGASVNPRLTVHNSFEHSTEFYLNKYFDKDTYLCHSSG